MVGACSDKTSVDAFLAVVFAASVALLAVVADIPKRLDAATVADGPALDIGADFDNDSGTFMTGTFGAECAHWWHSPVIHPGKGSVSE